MTLQATKLAQRANINPGQPFVFAATANNANEAPERPNNSILATPFPTFSLESDVGSITVGPGGKFNIKCIVVKELEPASYEFTCLIDDYVLVASRTYAYIVDHGSTKHDADHTVYHDSIAAIVEALLERIHTDKSGTFSVNDRVKLRKTKDRPKTEFYKPRTAIYIADRVTAASRQTCHQRPVNWSHSWSVRGHWRRLNNPESIGLDREGNRTTLGYTWVNSYKKGTGELLNKTRIVK